MKANAPRRKIFNDAVDLLTGNPEQESGNVRMLPADRIHPFRSHPFRLYDGERLEEMAESIREHGILCPVIVRTSGSGYEMLAGHNRLNAAKLVGLTEIPAIVKEGLPDAEAYVYVIETNMIQRSFQELSVSEKIAVMAERYDKVMSQGRRNDIIRELEQLDGAGTCGHDVHKSDCGRNGIGQESMKDDDATCGHDVHKSVSRKDIEQESVRDGKDIGGHNVHKSVSRNDVIQEDVRNGNGTCGHDVHKSVSRNDVGQESVRDGNGTCGHDVHKSRRSRDGIGQECGMTGRQAARYVRCSRLIPGLKDKLDDGSLTMAAGLELSYLPEKEQEMVRDVLDRNRVRLKPDLAGELRKTAGHLTEKDAEKILAAGQAHREEDKAVSVKVPVEVYHRYFSGMAAKDVRGILEAALELYFEKEGA